LEGGFVQTTKTVGNFEKSAAVADDTPKDLKAAYDELKKKVAALEAELEKKDALISKLQSQ
jgi:peptidoglycan hydrolase CwlO-like protein